jgi:hypothetical protein
LWRVELEGVQVQLEKGDHIRGGVDGDANAGRGRDGRAREAQDSLDKRRLAHAYGANDGNVVAIHGGGWLCLGMATTVSMGAVSEKKNKRNVSSMYGVAKVEL